MNVALACTAARAGATVLNHAEASRSDGRQGWRCCGAGGSGTGKLLLAVAVQVMALVIRKASASHVHSSLSPSQCSQVTGLIKDERGKVVGAKVRDALTGSMWDVHAKVVVNATGPFSDALRHMSDPKASKMIEPSSGVHITLPDYYSPENIGMIVPKTKDGRVVFMLPWLGHTIAGTTDAPTDVTPRPQPTEQEIQFILGDRRGDACVSLRRRARRHSCVALFATGHPRQLTFGHLWSI